jgi:hypothetical protein
MLHGCSRKETKAEAGGYSNTEIKSPKNRGVLAPINSTFQVCADCTSLRKTLSNSLCLKMKQLVTSGDVSFITGLWPTAAKQCASSVVECYCNLLTLNPVGCVGEHGRGC